MEFKIQCANESITMVVSHSSAKQVNNTCSETSMNKKNLAMYDRYLRREKNVRMGRYFGLCSSDIKCMEY